MINLKSIKTQLFPEYLLSVKDHWNGFENLKDVKISTENFSFYTSVSAVFSSKIKGEEIDLDSYL